MKPAKDIMKKMAEKLAHQSTVPFVPIRKDEPVRPGVSVHRHDFHELRFLIETDGRIYRADIVFPGVCHARLSPEENRSAHILEVHEDSCEIRDSSGICAVFPSPHVQELKTSFERTETETRLLLALIYLQACSGPVHTKETGKAEKLLHFLRDYYYRTELSIADAAREAGYSPKYIQRVIRLRTGLTPKAYLLKIRMEAALRFLTENRYLVKEVALLCGYSNPHYFSNAFRKYYGKAPRRGITDENAPVPVFCETRKDKPDLLPPE